MTHDELVLRACRWLRSSKSCHPILAEFQHLYSNEIPDAIGWTARLVHVVEAKVSRTDFFRDRRKLHRRAQCSMGNYRWYVAPRGLLAPADLPELTGLLEPSGRGLRVAVDAQHREPSPTGILEARSILRIALKRHELGVEWRANSFRFAPLPRKDKTK